MFPPFSDLNLTIDFAGVVTISDQRTSLDHGLDACEAGPGGVNCGLGARDTEQSGTLVSNITVTVGISRAFGQVTLTCESSEVWLPLGGYSWVYSNDPCTCKDTVDQHDNLESLLQVTIGGNPIDAPPLEQTKDTLYAEWLKKQSVCDESVNEAWIMDLKLRPGS